MSRNKDRKFTIQYNIIKKIKTFYEQKIKII